MRINKKEETMGDCMIRMIHIHIKNLKNVEDGDLQTRNYLKVKKNFALEGGDMLGIYGPNGSGKTALVDACSILKALLNGEVLSPKLEGMITEGEKGCLLEYTFFVHLNNYKYLLFYEVGIEREEDRQDVFVAKEKIAYSALKEDKWKPRVTIIDYEYARRECFKPVYRYTKIMGRDKAMPERFEACRALAKKKRTSFAFLKETSELFLSVLSKDHALAILVRPLVHFAKFNFCMITAENRGQLQLGELATIDLFRQFEVPKNGYESFILHFKQTNFMLQVLIPGLQLELVTHPNGELEFYAVKGKNRMPLCKESQGTKRMVMLIATIIPLYNYPNMCFVVDDLDEGIFEYIIGEFLEVIGEDMCGQLIFTGQNLRALEKIDKACIRVTTPEPTRKYISLENAKRKANLRDFYLKNLSQEGYKLQLKEAFKSASRITQNIQ